MEDRANSLDDHATTIRLLATILRPVTASEKETIMTGLKDKIVLITGASSGIGEATDRKSDV
ncbi:hypothetical protein EN792_054825, partial [Mesorhizobium sp. M00.F.Ca.ET.149.01.1.1]